MKITTKKGFLFIAFITLMVIAVPVTAYDVYWTETYASTGMNHFQTTNDEPWLGVTPAALARNITRVTITGLKIYHNQYPNATTVSGRLCDNDVCSGNVYGNYTGTITNTLTNSDSNDFSADLTLNWTAWPAGNWYFENKYSPNNYEIFRAGYCNYSSVNAHTEEHLHPGMFVLHLNAGSYEICSGTYTVYSGVYVPDPPVASFTASPESGYQPLTVNFTDTSTPGTSPITSWQWNFDDGYASTTQNAVHTFHLNGTYNVSLTVSDGSEFSTAYKNITVGLAPAIPGSYNLTVHVKDKSGVNMNHAHISLLPSSGPVLTKYTNAAGISNFIAVPGSAAAIIDVTMTGYPEYIETFTLATDMTKEITLGTSGIKLYVDVKDSIYGNILNGVNIGIQNTTSGVWRNATGHSGSIYYDSTGAGYEHPLSIGQTVVVAASKAGYRSDLKSVTIPSDQYTVTLQLVNINGSAPSSGNFTAVIAAGSMVTGLEIPRASITINQLGRMQATNEGGVAMFFNVPVGSYTLHVSAPGYQSVTDDITGTNQETVMKRVNLLPDGYRRDENNTIIGPGGTPIIPGGPFWSGNTSANERAAEGVSSFLDNIVSIGMLILILILSWFIKKIFFS